MHLHIYLIYQPICPAPPPIHPSTFDCAFLPPLSLSLSLRSQSIMTDGDGAPINVPLFLFFTLLSLFSTLSVSNVFERAKLSATYWLAASGEEH